MSTILQKVRIQTDPLSSFRGYWNPNVLSEDIASDNRLEG